MEIFSYVKYSAKFENFQFADVTFPIDDPFIEWFNLNTEENIRTIFTFAIHQGKSFDDGFKHTEYFVQKVLDYLAFKYIINVKELSLHSAYNDSTKTPILSASGGIITGGFGMLVISSPDIYFMDMMNLPDNHIQSTYWHEFRLALQNESPVECYLELYGILVKIIGDNQKKIDKFIQDNEPNVEKTEIPPRPGFTKIGVMETVYTRLRNEIARHRLSVPPERTRREVQLKIYKLKTLVKKAIEQSGRQDNQ